MRHRLLVSTVLLCSLALLGACGSEDDGGAVVADGVSGSDSGSGSGGSSGSGGGYGSDPDAPVDSPATVDPNTPVSDVPVTIDPVPAPGAGGDARIVNPTPGLIDPHPVALDSAILRDGDKVEARFYGGVIECNGIDHVDVVETGTDVTITVFAGIPADAAARTCIEIAELQAVIVPLDAPLGDRIVIDGSSGAPVPLS